ncbi:MAG TPA: hypothetical protein VE974_01770 [Thermoanaerobaculia bacterium]|nr:hypothetical protein [Thermoanaerobaculia bacterium]
MGATLAVLASLALLPLVPAFVLFKSLPSRATAIGPLSGLKVKLGGAFAGYVIVLVYLTVFYANNMNRPAYRSWQVHGALKYLGDGVAPNNTEVSCVLRPPLLAIEPDHTFAFEIPVVDGAEMPHLVFQAAGYEGQTVYLSQAVRYGENKYSAKVDAKNARIEFEQPITLRPKAAAPPYQPSVAAVPIAVGGSM